MTHKLRTKPVVIVGSGIAGLLLSIELANAGQEVILVSKGQLAESNTAWAQGGVAAVEGSNANDSKDKHLADTLLSGDGLTCAHVARNIIDSGDRLIARLTQLGVNFDRSSLALEGGHQFARVLHSTDATGREIVNALIHKVVNTTQIQIAQHLFLKEILVDDERATGIKAVSLVDGSLRTIEARAVVLATGGLGRIYNRSTNPDTATGDGITAAYTAGARLVDMEFVQFHPTALSLKGAPSFLISEAVRGAGAILLNGKGERFMDRFHPKAELATRDIVSRAIFATMQEENSSSVWLDLTGIDAIESMRKFPNIIAKVREFGIDPLVEPIPVAPATHYFMGGILTDELGRTTIPSLYAIGECASTGLHGANRLASNSLLEGGVMAINLASALSRNDQGWPALEDDGRCLASQQFPPVNPYFMPVEFDLDGFKQELEESAGLIRTESGLSKFIEKYRLSPQAEAYSIPFESYTEAPNKELSAMANPLLADSSILHSTLPAVQGLYPTPQAVPYKVAVETRRFHEAHSAYVLGMLIAHSALLRKESRGAHWREDYPKRDDQNYLCRLVANQNGWQWMMNLKSRKEARLAPYLIMLNKSSSQTAEGRA